MVEEKTVDGSVATCDEAAGETVDVETLYACFASVSPADEFDTCVGVVGIEINNLIRYQSIISSGGGWRDVPLCRDTYPSNTHT